MSYDPRVYDLCKWFLSGVPKKDTESNRQYLAQHIQCELEDFVQFMLRPKSKEEKL